MKNFILLLVFFVSCGAFASSTRSIDADQIQTSNHSITFTMPAVSGTGVISGQLPIGGQLIRDAYTGNGSTTVFTLTQTPFNTSHPMIFQNGILLTLTDDYTISGTTLTLIVAPAIAQKLLVIYSRY